MNKCRLYNCKNILTHPHSICDAFPLSFEKLLFIHIFIMFN
jgi:hypothetical protein